MVATQKKNDILYGKNPFFTFSLVEIVNKQKHVGSKEIHKLRMGFEICWWWCSFVIHTNELKTSVNRLIVVQKWSKPAQFFDFYWIFLKAKYKLITFSIQTINGSFKQISCEININWNRHSVLTSRTVFSGF